MRKDFQKENYFNRNEDILKNSIKLQNNINTYKQYKQSYIIRKVILLIFLLIFFPFGNSLVDTTNYVSNSLTDLTVQIVITQASSIIIPTGSLIIINIPRQFSAIELHNNIPYTGLSNFCTFDCSLITIDYYAYTFVLKNVFKTSINLSDVMFSYVIKNVKNPDIMITTSQFSVQIMSSDLMISYHSQTTPGFEIIAQQFQTLSSTLQSPYLSSLSTVNFNIWLAVGIDNIQIGFPLKLKWQNESQVKLSILSLVIVSSTTHQINFIKSEQSQNIDIDFPKILTSQIMKLSISSIYTPSSIMNMGNIQFRGYNEKGQIMRKSIYSIPSSQLNPQIIRLPKTDIQYDQLNNKIFTLVVFKIPQYIIINDKIQIQFPNQLPISSTNSDYVIKFGNSIQTSLTISTVNNSIQILSSISNFQIQISIIMTTIWPRTAQQLNNFIISAYRQTGSTYSQMLVTSCCSLKLKQKMTLNAVLSISNSQRLKDNVEYQFQLTHKFSSIFINDKFMIQFPKIFNIDSTLQTTICNTVIFSYISNPSSLNPNYICTVSKNMISLTNVFTSVQSPTMLSIKVNLTNPSKQPSQNFQIWTEDSTGNKIQHNNLVNIIINPASLSSLTIIPSSLITNTMTDYLFQIVSIGLVNKNYFIQITIPVEVKIQQKAIICQINSITTFCSYDKVTRIVLILCSSNLVSKSFQVKLMNLVNPQTVSTSSNFKVQILDTQKTLTQSSIFLTSGTTVKMNQLADYTLSRLFTSLSDLNTITNLTFILVLPYHIQITSTYKIEININTIQKINFNALSSSILKLNQINRTFSYSLSGSQILISVTFSPTKITNKIQMVFSNVIFYQDTIITNIKFSKQISGTFYKSLSKSSLLVLQKDLNAFLLSNFSVTQDSYYLNQLTGQMSIEINQIPPSLKFSQISIFIPSNYISSSNIYSYNSPSNSTTINFTINNLVNPIQITKQSFSFILYDNEGQIVAISKSYSNDSSQYFDVKCIWPCRSCKSITEKSICIDCYQITKNKMQYFRSTSGIYGSCTDHCIEGEYLNISTKACQKCSSNCSTCQIQIGSNSGDPQKCLTCLIGRYLYNYRCYDICPLGYYPNNIICSKCINNCAKCSLIDTCSECISPFVLSVGKCLQTCPLKTYSNLIINTSLYQCLNCSSNCLKCTSSTDCQYCSNGFYLYNKACLSVCPVAGSVQLYPNLNNSCTNCQCVTCSGKSYNCNSCSVGLILDPVKHVCVSKCQDGQYNNNNMCQNCAQNCLYCDSFSTCKICNQPYILYKTSSTNSSCVNKCPNSTILTIKTISLTTKILQCLQCITNCKSCSLSISFCTQCITGYVLFKNQCINQCPIGYYNISNKCRLCSPECMKCDINDPYNCTDCIDGYYLYKQFCYFKCPQGTYPQISLKKCLSCQLLCQTCLNATQCTSCKVGYFLFTNNNCYTSCPTTPIFYYQYKSQCTLCQPQCKTCLSSPIQCSTCSSHFYYQNQDTKECSTICADNYYKIIQNNINKCVKCKSPCLQCDTTFDSCSKCNTSSNFAYLLKGECLNSCPHGFYGLPDYTCKYCPFPCATCDALQCTSCQQFAYLYKQSCVLDCANMTDLKYSKNNYCTNCKDVPFCTYCKQSTISKSSCATCVYPYVLFEGQCLNSCPIGFQIQLQISRICIQSEQYLNQQRMIYEKNKPLFPFSFLIIFIIISLIIYPLSNLAYPYTYHLGFWIFLLNLMDYSLVYYWLIDVYSRYTGQYINNDQKQIPLILVMGGLALNLIILGWLAFGYNLKFNYLKDVRYQQWKQNHKFNFIILIFLIITTGSRSHKLFYSKLFGLQKFSYRIISVEKFKIQDRINFLVCFGDIIIVCGFIVITFNIFIEYSVLYLTAFEILMIKILQWIILAIDSKKPDRGFFYGDEKAALQEIQKQYEEQQQKLLRRVDTDYLVKLIRKKSMGHLSHQLLYPQIQKDQLISVYNPDDYQDVPKIPLRRIPRQIQKGLFRKGRKITVQERLQRYADSIKPNPIKKKQDGYINGLIYWKPPKNLKENKKIKIQPMSEESMLKILQDKQLQYKQQLDQIQQINFGGSQTKINFRTGQYFFKNKNSSQFDQLQGSIQSIQELQGFQGQQSSIFNLPSEQLVYEDLMNLNYAKKKHLPRAQRRKRSDDNEMRILYHSPMKKRASRLQ